VLSRQGGDAAAPMCKVCCDAVTSEGVSMNQVASAQLEWVDGFGWVAPMTREDWACAFQGWDPREGSSGDESDTREAHRRWLAEREPEQWKP